VEELDQVLIEQETNPILLKQNYINILCEVFATKVSPLFDSLLAQNNGSYDETCEQLKAKVQLLEFLGEKL
jgi:hypothetical protein